MHQNDSSERLLFRIDRENRVLIRSLYGSGPLKLPAAFLWALAVFAHFKRLQTYMPSDVTLVHMCQTLIDGNVV